MAVVPSAPELTRMDKSPKTPDRETPRRAPYSEPKLRAYGSVQSMTLAKDVGNTMDGPGGGGKTQV